MSKRYFQTLRDTSQYKFTQNGLEKINDEPIPNRNEIYSCPFCLHQGKLNEFQLKNKNGSISTKRVQCPECQNTMLINSLIITLTPEQFANWIWNYPAPDFWKKCNFNKFRDKLYKTGISKRFWETYNQLKQDHIPNKLAPMRRPDVDIDEEYRQLKQKRKLREEQHENM